MKNCWFLCEKMSLTELDPFVDGDVNLLKRVYLYLFSFMRKFSMGKGIDVDLSGGMGSVNGLGVEPVDEEKA